MLRFLLAPCLAVCCLAAAPSVSDDFYKAIRGDDFAAVTKLLQSGADVNVKDDRGATPLMYAAAVGSEAMMRRLIEAGADVNARNSFQATALLWCSNSLPRVRLLVEHGADVNMRSKQGHAPVEVAAHHADSLEIIKFLVNKGASLKMAPDEKGGTALANAADANDTATVKYLLEKGGAEILAGPAGPMALMNAASYGNAELVKLLLAKGAPVNAQSPAEVDSRVKNGPIALGSFTALILAVAPGDTETVRLLLDAGADVNARDVRGMTPLMLAVATDHPNQEVIRMLLERHPDTKIRSKAGETALDWALKFKDRSIIAAVRTASPGVEAAERKPPAITPASASDARAALQKSIGLIQTAGTTTFREGGCVSCHGGNITVTAVAAARRMGIRVDEPAAAEYVRATRLQYAAFADLMLERSDSPTPLIESNALFALAQEGVPADRIIDAMVNSVAARQLPDGYWIYRSIMRPPTADSPFSNTAVAIRVMREYAPPARKAEFEDRIARAAHALESAEATTTEDCVMRLLGLKWAGVDSAKIAKAAKAVAGLQREDGGWAQTRLLSSDAYATGTALHALYETGMPADSPAYRKGVAFLLRTQAADGSWYVASRSPKFQPYFEGGFPYGHDQWISQWGTGWAAIALAHALPEQRAAVQAR